MPLRPWLGAKEMSAFGQTPAYPCAQSRAISNNGPVTSLLLMLNMACTLFRLTPEEALAWVTRNAARALALGETHGTLAVGKAADFAIWDIERPAELAYRIGFNPLGGVVRAGRLL